MGIPCLKRCDCLFLVFMGDFVGMVIAHSLYLRWPFPANIEIKASFKNVLVINSNILSLKFAKEFHENRRIAIIIPGMANSTD